MTLNKQLLCVSLLLLSLPWAGYQYLVDMSESLQDRQVSLLENNGQLIAQAIAQSSLLNATTLQQTSANNDPIYCFQARRPIRPDGYMVDREWTNQNGDPLPWSLYSQGPNIKVSYRCSIYNDQLQMLFDINDQQTFYRNPSLTSPFNGDRLILQTGLGINFVFATSAAGKLNPIRVDQTGDTLQHDITATWVDIPKGYQIEMLLPRQLVGEKLSFIVVDQLSTDPNDNHVFGPGKNIPSEQLPQYLYPSTDYLKLITPFAQTGMRVKLLNPQGWLLAEAGEAHDEQQTQQAHWLLKQLYQRLLKQKDAPPKDFLNQVNLSSRAEVVPFLNNFDDTESKKKSASQWYVPKNHDEESLIEKNHYILASATPVLGADEQAIGILVVEQSSQQTSDLTDQAFNRLFLTSAITLVAVILVMIGYASWLSWRIRRLSHAARQAIESKGMLGDHFPNVRSKDEIGTLARDFSALIQRVDEYTEYLKDLSQKLSHELRTPLAIIHSSLDNLGNQNLDESSQTYQKRAKEGAARLGNIITAMSEARRVEESLEHAEFETIDIIQLLSDLHGAYQDLYPSQHVDLVIQGNKDFSTSVIAVPDLLVQMIDKLMDNAHSFCPENGRIEIGISLEKESYTLHISNEGSLLPLHMQNQLFDNLVSIRKNSTESHLGMGLHIVQLICDYHQGTANAQNNPLNTGVIFTLCLSKHPKISPP